MTTLLLSDSFAGPSVFLENHLADTANPWFKHPLFTGSIVTDGTGLARVSATNQDARYFSSMVPNSAEYTLAGTFKMMGTLTHSSMICARMSTTANTFYYVNIVPSSSLFILGKIVDGVNTELDTAVYVNNRNASFTCVFECNNALKRVTVAGAEIMSSADNTITAAGRAGLRMHASNSSTDMLKLDTFSVSDESVDATPPPAPAGVAATPKVASADLTWSPVADIGGAMRQYHIEAKLTSAGAGSWVEVHTAGAAVTSKRIYNLTPGVSWDLRMRAEDQALNFGSYSSTVAITPTAAGATPVSFNDLIGTATNVTFDTMGLMVDDVPDAAATFNGANSVVSIPHDAAFNLPSLETTVSAVIRPTSIPGAGVVRSIVSRTGQLQLRVSGSALECDVTTDQGAVTATGAAAMTAGSTYDCAAVLSAGQLQLYLNAAPLGAPVAAPGAVASVTAPLEIGAAGGAQFFHGEIKDVAVLAEALAPARITRDNADISTEPAIPPTPTPKLATLADNFDDGVLDPTRWTVTAAGPTEASGRLVIPATGAYSTVRSTDVHDFTDSSFAVQVVSQPVAHAGDQLAPLVRSTLDAQAQVQFIYVGATGTLRAQYMNTSDTWVDVQSATYVPTSHAWRRMREAAGTIYWEVSSDGAVWGPFASVAWSASGWPRSHLESTNAFLFAGNNQGAVRPDFVIDNVNTEGIPLTGAPPIDLPTPLILRPRVTTLALRSNLTEVTLDGD